MKELQKRISIKLAFLRLKFFLFLNNSRQKEIAKIKAFQKVEFEKLKKEFEVNYEKIQIKDTDRYVSELWKDYNRQLEKVFLPYPKFFFLQNQLITRTMFSTRGGEWFERELWFLKSQCNKNLLKKVLIEDFAGGALISNKEYLTSYNSIHHLYHFLYFFYKTKVDMKNVNTVIEWGGGYGNAAKIFMRLKNTPLTYILIDTPLLCCLQWLYLTTVFGRESVNFIDSEKSKIEKNKINILPLAFINNFKIKGDLFVSTWALSESSKYSQDYVFGKDWFCCPHLLLAFQDKNYWLPDAGRLKTIVKEEGCIIEDIVFQNGNYYAFK